MRISVDYDETDVAKMLGDMIKHKNKDEFVKLITPMICESSNACTLFFKLLIDGNKLPKTIDNRSMCKTSVDQLGYQANKDDIREKFADEDDKIIVTVKRFKGYHSYSAYEVEFTNLLSDGTQTKDNTYVALDSLEEIEDF
jgi:hypothetical protein